MTKLGKEKEEATRVPPKGSRRISVVSLMFFLISFLGWCMETIYCSSWFTNFDDRYFLLSAGIATLFELVFGLLFDSLGVRLWSYRRFPLNYKGYVCLYFSLLWGTLITLSMSTFFDPLYRALARIPPKIAIAANVVLWVAVISDFSFNIVYLLREGHHFELIFSLLSGFL